MAKVELGRKAAELTSACLPRLHRHRPGSPLNYGLHCDDDWSYGLILLSVKELLSESVMSCVKV
jgi:hypothetical protein